MTPDVTNPEADLEALYRIAGSRLKNPLKPLDKSVKHDMMDIKVMKESIKDLTERVENLERILRKSTKNVKAMQVNNQNPTPKKKV